jgi:hypothetical protein
VSEVPAQSAETDAVVETPAVEETPAAEAEEKAAE